MTPIRRLGLLTTILSVLLVVVATRPAAAAATVTIVSRDTLTNAQSQHQTEVEPDTFAVGSTEVMAFQVGRIYNGGAGAIGFATSTDGGTTWTNGLLPSLTTSAPVPGPYSRATDPSVAYDASHGRWLIASQAMNGTTAVAIVVSSSTDGVHWSAPTVAATKGPDLDKDWIVCDNVSTPYRGHCYIVYDANGAGDLIYNVTSTDGGATWGPARTTAGSDTGIGGQPVVLPNGTVVVPGDNSTTSSLISYRSTDGGTTWGPAATITRIRHHAVHGNIRVNKLPSAEVGSDGTVYLAWEDCRFRTSCASNDIVVATSRDGLAWSAPVRVPIDPVSSSAEHFLPGIAVDPASTAAAPHLAVTYYFYPAAACTASTCQLQVGQISSSTGLAGWGTATTLAGPMLTKWLANTNQGRMVGDYISTSFVSGRPVAAFPVATAPDATGFHEAMAAGSAA
ncbi:MAG: uncharacterized protein JWP02_3836 [Acidimicrobiales bacterium]|nr:uncharacterized protein [Acidimicrobiales bacterium]